MSEPCCILTQAYGLLEWNLLGRPDTEDKWEIEEARKLWYECYLVMAEEECTPENREIYQMTADALRELF